MRYDNTMNYLRFTFITEGFGRYGYAYRYDGMYMNKVPNYMIHIYITRRMVVFDKHYKVIIDCSFKNEHDVYKIIKRNIK